MSNYSSKALTREEALKLKALGESYDVTPMSIKEAIIAGASSEDGDESSKEDFFVQALTNDERLDFYRNSSSESGESGESGGSGEITDFFKTINVELYLSDAITAYMEQNSLSYVPVQIGAPRLVSTDIPPQPGPEPGPKSAEKALAKSVEGINFVLFPITDMLEIYLSEVPKIIECSCPIGGGVAIVIPAGYQSTYTFVEASGSVVMEYSDLHHGGVVANGDCAITIGLPSEFDDPDDPDDPDEPVTPQV